MTDLPTKPDDALDIAPLEELSPATLMKLADVEDRLARGWTRGKVEHWLHTTYEISPRHARRLFKQAETRWQRECDEQGRDGRRGQLRNVAWTGVEKALKKQGLIVDREGGKHWYDNPDIGGMARLLEFLARLDGDLTQPGPTQGGFGEDAFTALHVHLYGTPPPKEVAARVVDAVAEGDEQALPAVVTVVDSKEAKDGKGEY